MPLSQHTRDKRLPVTVLSGFLGALLHKSREGFISRIQGGSWDA